MKIILLISTLCSGQLVSSEQYPSIASCEKAADSVSGFTAECVEVQELKVPVWLRH